MLWEKLGLVYVANREGAWRESHAYVPTAIRLSAEIIRVYVAFLDVNNVGRVGYVDVSSRDPNSVVRVSASPALDIGEPGTFDDNGVAPISVVRMGDELRLYYAGFQLGTKTRYAIFSGLATSRDGEVFHRVSQAPILDRCDGELHVRSAPHVHHMGSTWRMWYVAGNKWTMAGGKAVPTYNIRYLESADGIHWGTQGRVVIEREAGEFGLGRPYVLDDNGLLRMWYSARGERRPYHIRYAESKDGLNWQRKDADVGIYASSSGWDSEMICFPCVLRTEHGTYMFYNGNGYGQSGFGVARLRT